MIDELSIESGPKLPPVYNGIPETIKGTVFAVGKVQGTKYIPGHIGAPVPDTFPDGNPRMQIVFYIVGETGKVLRTFASKKKPDKMDGSPWKAWIDNVVALGSKSFSALIGHTFLFNVKTTYKPGGTEVAFREWAIVESINEDYRPNMLEEFKSLPQGVLPTFYYPGFSPEEMAAKAQPAQPVVQAQVVAGPVPPPQAAIAPQPVAAGEQVPLEVYDDDIPFDEHRPF